MDEIKTYDEIYVLKDSGYFGVIPPVMSMVRGTSAQSSANFTTAFFTADRPYQVIRGRVRTDVAATDGTMDIRKVASGVDAASGTSILASSVNLTSTANTNQDIVLSGTLGNTRIDRGDSLCLVASGLLTNLQGVSTSLILKAV